MLWKIQLRSSFICTVCVLLIMALSPARCFAWSAAGHMLAAQLAYRQLSPEQRQHAAEILRHLPAFYHDIGPATDALPPEERDLRIFMMASIWPDLIKDEKHPAHAESRPGWHVTWLPITAQGYKLPKSLSKAGNTNTMEALPILMRDFGTSSALPMERRAVNLAWILHLVGDLHQPLHAIAYYSKQWPAGDHSGSMFYVRPQPGADPTPLHKVWDGLFGFRDLSTTSIQEMAEAICADPQLSRTSLESELRKKTPRQWIEESRDIARKEAYLLETTAPLQGLPVQQAKHAAAKGEAVPVLPAGYVQHARTIARKREALAGDRLADYLRGTL